MRTLWTALLLASCLSLEAFGKQLLEIKIRKHLDKPVIAFEVNGKKAYFLIDTGSDISLVNLKSKKKYGFSTYRDNRGNHFAQGLDMQKHVLYKVGQLILSADERPLPIAFLSMDMSALCSALKAKTGLPITGIIGNDFLRKFNASLNYQNYTLILPLKEVKDKKDLSLISSI